MVQVWIASRHHLISKNDILTHFPEVFNIMPYFKVAYSSIIDLLYYSVKEIGLTAHDVLDELAFYEILSLIEKWQEDVKERNKQQEKENERYENMMADAKRHQTLSQNSMKQNMPQMPQMPSMPKL